MTPRLIAGALLLLMSCAASAETGPLLATEQCFADFLDAHGAVETIDAGTLREIDGKGRSYWLRLREQKRRELTSRLRALRLEGLAVQQVRAVQSMRATFEELAGASMTPDGKCRDARHAGSDLGALKASLYACFGHAVHIAAIRARPAFFWPDTLFMEAFADVPSWSVFDPAWQRTYLGRAVSRSDSLREQYALVMLDVAWGLFELRMLRDPAADPNAAWTAITQRYLSIAPHPEWSWWAVRAQLVDAPGYMVNYAAGAVLTAQLRRKIRESIGPFDAGNPRWFAWLSEQCSSTSLHGNGEGK